MALDTLSLVDVRRIAYKQQHRNAPHADGSPVAVADTMHLTVRDRVPPPQLAEQALQSPTDHPAAPHGFKKQDRETGMLGREAQF